MSEQLTGARLNGYLPPEFPEGIERLAQALDRSGRAWTMTELERAARQVKGFARTCQAQPSGGRRWMGWLEFEFGPHAILLGIPSYQGNGTLGWSPAFYCTDASVRRHVRLILLSMVDAMGFRG